MGRNLLIFLTLVVALLNTGVASEPVILENADSSRIIILDDSTLTKFFGNVHFTQAETEIHADSVFISSEGYYRFMGNVKIADTNRVLTGINLTYDENSDMFYGSDSTRLVDRSENLILTGDSLRYDNREEILTVYDNPKVIFNYADFEKTINVDSDSLRYFVEEGYAEAYGDVHIRKSDLVANCGKALLMPDSNRLVLTESPLAVQGANRVSGDSMAIFLENDLLDFIDVHGNAEAIYRQSDRETDSTVAESRLNAKNIKFLFELEELKKIVSAGNSYSEYIPAESDSASTGRNIASGDSIKLYFENRDLNEVEIITSVEGTYYSSGKYSEDDVLLDRDTIRYKAQHLRYIIADDDIKLYNTAEIKHERVTLGADTIVYNTNDRNLRARPTWEETESGDSIFNPVILNDGNDEIFGKSLVYNIDNQRGKISEMDTKLEEAFYYGRILRKEEEDVLLVSDGQYIPCEYRDANFHFYSKKMKLIEDDRVIARPIILYIEKIPVLYLPYFVFSIKKDRHSGFLPFDIGNFERGSRFVNNLGYYWALSDYYDLTTSIDYNDEYGLTFNLGVRYALRYKFSGNISGSYSRETTYDVDGETNSNRWRLNMSHNHTISQTASLKGSGNFVSDSRYIRDILTDKDERLNRQLRSQLNFNKRWGQASLTAVVQATNRLDDNQVTYQLPRLSLSLPSRRIFAGDKSTAGNWYENLYLSYSATSNNYISESGPDSAQTKKHYSTLIHSFRLSMPSTILRYLTISPAASITENWWYIFNTDQSEEQGLMTETALRSGNYSFSLSANTKIYGLFTPPISGLIGLRHVVTPSISYSYRPKNDYHEDEASFSGVSLNRTESQALGWSLSNLFQIKYKWGEEERKLDLFTLSFSSSYNFKAERERWSPLRTTLRSSTIPNLTFSLSASHDFYDEETGDLMFFSPRLTNVSISTDFNLNTSYNLPGQVEEDFDTPSRYSTVDRLDTRSSFPFSMRLGHRYSESRFSTGTSITHWITLSCELNVTRKWRFSFTQNYDIKDKTVTDRELRFDRDLHCWEASFVWIPDGIRAGYYFKINLKQIPDIKFEKSESGLRGALFD